jgi:hypothetical protein
VLLLFAAAYYEHTYTVGAGAPNTPVVHDRWHSHWLGRLIDPGKKVELQEMCASGNATIHEEVSFLSGLVAALTAEIYAPTTVEISCDNRSTDLGFSAAEVERIATSPEFVEWVAATAPGMLDQVQEAQSKQRKP